MNLDNETKDKIDKLPLVMRQAVLYLLDAIDNMINGKCDESAVLSTMGTLNQNSKGKYSREDLMNYDQAGKALGFGCTNRTALKKLLDKHNIKQVEINNMKCGFRRDEIMALRDKLNEDIRNREIKRKNATYKREKRNNKFW